MYESFFNPTVMFVDFMNNQKSKTDHFLDIETIQYLFIENFESFFFVVVAVSGIRLFGFSSLSISHFEFPTW